MAHAYLAELDIGPDDDYYDEDGGDDNAERQQQQQEHRYVAILRAGVPEEDCVWRQRGGGGRERVNSVPCSGSSVVVTRSFVVTDTGMTVAAGTVCDVIKGDEETASGDSDQSPARYSSHIYVRFSHPEPPWAVLVGRLDGMSTELQVISCRAVVFGEERLRRCEVIFGWVGPGRRPLHLHVLCSALLLNSLFFFSQYFVHRHFFLLVQGMSNFRLPACLVLKHDTFKVIHFSFYQSYY